MVDSKIKIMGRELSLSANEELTQDVLDYAVNLLNQKWQSIQTVDSDVTCRLAALNAVLELMQEKKSELDGKVAEERIDELIALCQSVNRV